jgi:hypothetical protein
MTWAIGACVKARSRTMNLNSLMIFLFSSPAIFILTDPFSNDLQVFLLFIKWPFCGAKTT